MTGEEDIYTALRGFLLSITTITDIYQAQDPRVPMPKGRYVIMTPIRRERQSTGMRVYDIGVNQMQIGQVTVFVFQLDVYGEGAGDCASVIEQLWRTEYAVDLMHSLNANITPLFTDTVVQATMINAESNYEPRYTLTIHFQVIQNIRVNQALFDQVKLADNAFIPTDGTQ